MHTMFSITTTTLSVSMCARLMHCATCEREVSLVVWPTVEPGLFMLMSVVLEHTEKGKGTHWKL